MILNETKYQDGFTLIEVVIAILVLMVGVLGAIVMQNASIGGNSRADHVTESANLASDQLEILMAMDYDKLIDTNTDGNAGLNDTANPDGQPTVQGNPEIYWNVAEHYPIYRTKTIRVIVRRTDGGVNQDVVFDFMRMEPI